MCTSPLRRGLPVAAPALLLCLAGTSSAVAVGGSDCFIVHSAPGCSERVCVKAICPHDPYCCSVTWDALCVGYANVSCTSRLGDLNGDDTVGPSDLACLLVRWGTAAGDLNADLLTDSADLGLLLANWS